MDEPTAASATEKRGSVRAKNARPTMQIYRPPGLRGASDQKMLTNSADSDQASNASSASSRSSGDSMGHGRSRRAGQIGERKSTASRDVTPTAAPKTPSSKAQPSPPAAMSPVDESSRGTSARPKAAARLGAPNTSTKELKKKPFTRQYADEIGRAIHALGMESAAERALVDEFVAGEMTDEALAHRLGEALARYAVEQRGKQSGKVVARACAALLQSAAPAGAAFYLGLRDALTNRFNERAALRAERPRVWIGLLAFACELCASVGFLHEGGLVGVVFDLFAFILRPGGLDSLRIEELECMMSALLSAGYDLERHCPDRLGALQDALRDAFIEARESWARKMLLLMIELGAGGWQLAPDANEYYFQ